MLRRLPFTAVLLAMLACGEVHAQGHGTVQGTVHDASGAELVGARVAAAGRSAATDGSGRFVLRGVPAGTHRVEAALLGYARGAVEVTVAPGAEVNVRILLAATPLELAAIQVTAAQAGEGAAPGLAQATARLSGRALDREAAGSLAATLATQPGVAVRSMGPAASMPVLRGLTGDRILVLHDGQRAGDLAGSADDHGTTLDPLMAQRVEVVRGPAALLYGNNALGGVVNVVSEDIPLHRPASVRWTLAGHSESAHPGGGGALRVVAPVGGAWVASGRAGARRAGDVRLAGPGRLGNTAAESWSAALGAGFVGGAVTGGAVLRGYGFAYGLPVPPGTDPVRLEGERGEAQARLEAGGAKIEAGAQRYRHDEVDARSGALLQRFALRTGTAAVLVRRSVAAWGASLLVKDYRATGPAALTPPARSHGAGAFAFREVAVGRATLQLGARADGYRIRSEHAEKFGAGRIRSFGALTGSAGVRIPLAEGVSASASASRAFRAPTVEELFSGAAHAGTGAVELGDPALGAERATALEAGLRIDRARWAAGVAVHRSRIAGYVHPAARGDTVVGGDTLPVLVYAQAPARIAGAEASLEVAVSRTLVLGATGDWLRGSLADGTPLSYLPPARMAATLRWEGARVSLGGQLRHVFRQDRTGAADELPTAAHTLLRLDAGFRFRFAGGAHAVVLRADNLIDARYRDATSRIKDFAPAPGRNLSILYRVIR